MKKIAIVPLKAALGDSVEKRRFLLNRKKPPAESGPVKSAL